jgi:hypothetical protein
VRDGNLLVSLVIALAAYGAFDLLRRFAKYMDVRRGAARQQSSDVRHRQAPHLPSTTMPNFSLSNLWGTWELRSYEVWDDQGEVMHPMGHDPIGYAIFSPCGNAFVQLARRAPATVDLDLQQREELANSYVAYFGRLEHHPSRAEFSVAVNASNRAQYLGTTQVRPYDLEGDELVLGIPGQYRARLQRRERPRDVDA